VLEVEASLVISSPVGRWHLAGQGQELLLVLPREAGALAIWRTTRPLRALLRAMTACDSGNLTLRLSWRDRIIGRVGGPASILRSSPVRFEVRNLLAALLWPRAHATAARV
jgi:hypothetical protein